MHRFIFYGNYFVLRMSGRKDVECSGYFVDGDGIDINASILQLRILFMKSGGHFGYFVDFDGIYINALI